jgi:uncharacterized membrane protein
MTDETTGQPPATPADATAPATRLAATPDTSEDTVVIAAQLSDAQGVLAEGAVAVQGGHALVVARFADTDAAQAVYEDLRAGEAAGRLHIDGVLVVHADEKGDIKVQQLTDHHTKRGLTWGVVAGVVAGIVFPPSILASAVTLGGAGAVLGKLGNIREKGKVEKAVAGVITAGTSGILALVDLQDVPAVKDAMPAAQQVATIPVDEATATTIEQAATTGAEGSPPAS